MWYIRFLHFLNRLREYHLLDMLGRILHVLFGPIGFQDDEPILVESELVLYTSQVVNSPCAGIELPPLVACCARVEDPLVGRVEIVYVGFYCYGHGRDRVLERRG